MINEEAVKRFLRERFPGTGGITIRKLGSGVQGSGFLVEMEISGVVRHYVVKSLLPHGLGHDYPSDRAAVFLLDLDEYKNLPGHVMAIDVIAELEDGSVKSIGGGKEYYLLMERALGTDYFRDLNGFAHRSHLESGDVLRIKALASYLGNIHSVKKDSRSLYWRKLRDIIGHGECLMGVFDTYPDGFLRYEEMAVIEKLCIDWRARLKPKTARLCQIHGDFHPGNIWFQGPKEFVLLDRSRGPWGEPADDVTALSVNYIFFSVKHHGDVRGPYLEGLRRFYEEYLRLTGDEELLEVVAPFYAFRGAVVANPFFYPAVSNERRNRILNFVKNVLLAERFEIGKVNEYLTG